MSLLVEDARQFLTESTDPFHAVRNSIHKLVAAGFERLDYQKQFPPLKKGGKYYYTVHHSTLVAFTVGGQSGVANGNTHDDVNDDNDNVSSSSFGFHIIGGHTDSPNLAVKPKSKKPPKNGCIQLGVTCYGGGLWHTWFDRDLSISGKVLVRNSTKGNDSNKIQAKLIKLGDPVARVSTLAIHLQSAEERAAFKVNKEDHTCPILATETATTEAKEQLEQAVADQLDVWQTAQEPALLQRIAQQLELDAVSQIADFELSLYDTQPAAIGGLHREFLYAARLDNLATVFCAVQALADHDPVHDTDVAMICCFDHEEVGSKSSQGAGSPVILEAQRRVARALGYGADDDSVIAQKSFCLSIDQAHAVHPNYASKHESQHAPLLNRGLVVKTNVNQRYATNSGSAFVVRELGRKLDIPIQEFSVRNDCPCGSTIGPTIASLTGMRVVDAGMPQLSMHSCREVMGTTDLEYGYKMFRGFFQLFRQIDSSMDDSDLYSCSYEPKESRSFT